MEDLVEIQCGLYRGMPEDMSFRIQVLGEIDYCGYALLACRPQSGRGVLGLTVGLSSVGHPEIISAADREQDVFALLKHLAQQVMVNNQSFAAGKHSTALFNELVFAEVSIEVPMAALIHDVLDGFEPDWLICKKPLDISRLDWTA